MNDKMLVVYHHLPARMRSIVASVRGAYLRTWRYSSETECLVEEALERESWSPARWHQWQQERLTYILHRAATKVPYYREHWAERRKRGDRASCLDVENWPILQKEVLRQNPKAFVADDCDTRQMFHEHTSGTTGKSLDLWCSRETVRRWYALSEARWRGWYGVSRHDRWAILGGQLITPASRQRPPFWVWNAGLNQLYMSSYHLAPDYIPHYLNALIQHRVEYILGYTSSLYTLAQEVLRQQRRDIQMRVVITNAEPVFAHQRQAIAEAFQCPVRETYGMAEVVMAASECQAERLHLWPEVGITELVKDGDPGSTSGEFVCTGLLNPDMPLIRYRVGDRGILPAPETMCECGRSLPLLTEVEGRIDDALYTRDGRRVGRLDPVFKANLSIREAQIIQEKLNQLRVRYVPTSEYTGEAGEALIKRLRARMGEIEVILEPFDEIPKGANGKFQAVICNLSTQERQFLENTTR
jgi:phenylacetate-CoA ligase